MIRETEGNTGTLLGVLRGTAILGLLILATLAAATVRAQEKDAQQSKEGAKSEKKEEGLPLKPTRKISFTTEEGTWMSLDVSPDGKTIVFVLLGDLYLLPMEGGEAKRVSSGLAWDCQPRFSPGLYFWQKSDAEIQRIGP